MFRPKPCVFGGNEDRLTTAPETSDAADITFLQMKQASEGPGPPIAYGAIPSELQVQLDSDSYPPQLISQQLVNGGLSTRLCIDAFYDDRTGKIWSRAPIRQRLARDRSRNNHGISRDSTNENFAGRAINNLAG